MAKAPATPASVEAAADFITALLDAGLKTGRAGRPQLGLLIALQVASRVHQHHLAMVGTAFPMKVSPALLDMSLNQPLKAIDMVNQFSHSMLAPPPSAMGPGTWLYGTARALMRRVLASNPTVNVFHRGFGLRPLQRGPDVGSTGFVLGQATSW
jgi:hypothetical protein